MEASKKSEITEVEVKVEELKQEAGTLATRAGSIVITDDPSWEAAGEFLRQIKDHVSRVKDWFKPLKDSAHQAHKQICNRETETIAAFETADKRLRPAWLDYNAKKEAERKAEEDRLRAEAQKRLQEEADRQRAVEQKRLEDEALKRAIETGDESVLEEVPEAPPVVVPVAPPVILERPKQAGISVRKKWTFEVIDPAKIPLDYMVPDMVGLQKLADALGERANLSGVRFYQKDIMGVKLTIGFLKS